MGAGASAATTDAEKVAAYDKLVAKLPELVAAQAVDEAKLNAILAEPPKNTAKPKQPESFEAAEDMNLEEVFQSFCAIYRETAMTNTIFAKFCNDAKIVDKKFPKPQIDMVWSKAAGKEKKVGFDIFLKLLDGIAAAKGMPLDKLHAHVKAKAVVKNSGTKGESRFYDDKNTWTGVATKGGPSTIDPKASLSQLADRDNKADVRGVIKA